MTPEHEPSRKRKKKLRHSLIRPKHYYTREEIKRALTTSQELHMSKLEARINRILTRVGDRTSITYAEVTYSEKLALDSMLLSTSV